MHQTIAEVCRRFQAETLAILNLQPFARTLVLAMNKHFVSHVNDFTAELAGLLEKEYQARFTGYLGKPVDKLTDIGRCYKQALKLMEYSFHLQAGECISFPSFLNTGFESNDYSIAEYSYIHKAEALIGSENWNDLTQVLDELKTSLLSNSVKNSKVLYIYKELFAGMIRYLFTQRETAVEMIEELNNHIINFEDDFNNIHEIHAYYLDLVKTLTTFSESMHPHISKAVRYIDRHYKDNISLASTAEHIGISSEYLSRLFKQELRVKYIDYLTNIRIQQAKKLLLTSEKTLSEICLEVGYPTAAQLNRVFKAKEGITPSKFRKQN